MSDLVVGKRRRFFQRYERASLLDFNPNETYTSHELDLFADAWIRSGFRELRNFEHPVVLLEEHLGPLRRREVYTSTGDHPDAAIMAEMSPDGHFMYNRNHPHGRKVRTLEQALGGRSSYYR